MPTAPHWLREKRRQQSGPGFQSLLMRFDEPVTPEFTADVADDLDSTVPPGSRWVVVRESSHSIRATLIPAGV